jgi:parallel beta-helix repeat protein
MRFIQWLQRAGRQVGLASGKRYRSNRASSYRPRLEALEARTLLSSPGPVAHGLLRPNGTLAPPPSGHQVIVVHPGDADAIQDAVDAANPGATILLQPGTYHESFSVAKAGIDIVGLTGSDGSGAVITNPGNKADGIIVRSGSDGFVLKNVTIEGFGQNGLFMDGVSHFRLADIQAINDGEHGLFPIHSSHGLILGCTATGNADIGLYVGQSADVTIRGNTVFGNVNGIELQNTTDVTVVANNVYDNVAGIVLLKFPETDVSGNNPIVSKNNVVVGNFVHDNNHVNFGKLGSLESFEPTGTGILIVGSDSTTVQANVVTGNGFVGIGVVSTLILKELDPHLPKKLFAGYEPNPDGTKIENNIALGNGFASPIASIPGVDLLWDGSGKNNCWSGNIYLTSVPLVLPEC